MIAKGWVPLKHRSKYRISKLLRYLLRTSTLCATGHPVLECMGSTLNQIIPKIYFPLQGLTQVLDVANKIRYNTPSSSKRESEMEVRVERTNDRPAFGWIGGFKHHPLFHPRL